MPWLDALGSEEGIINFVNAGPSRGCFVQRYVYERLGAGSDTPAA